MNYGKGVKEING